MKSLCHSTLFLVTLGLLSLNATAKSLVNPADSPTHSFICDAPDLEKRAVAVIFDNPQKLAPPETHYVELAAKSCGSTSYTVTNCRTSADYISDMTSKMKDTELNERDITSAEEAIIKRLNEGTALINTCPQVGRSVTVYDVPTNDAKQIVAQVSVLVGVIALGAIYDPVAAAVVIGSYLVFELYNRSNRSFIGKGATFVVVRAGKVLTYLSPGIANAVYNWWNTPGPLDNIVQNMPQHLAAAMQDPNVQQAFKAALQANVAGEDVADSDAPPEDGN